MILEIICKLKHFLIFQVDIVSLRKIILFKNRQIGTWCNSTVAGNLPCMRPIQDEPEFYP